MDTIDIVICTVALIFCAAMIIDLVKKAKEQE